MSIRILVAAGLGLALPIAAAAADNFEWNPPVQADAQPVKAVGDGDLCALPGELVAEDEADWDVTSQDIEAVYFAEPTAFDHRLAVTLKVADLFPVPAPNTIYYVRWVLNDGIEYWVSFEFITAEESSFEYGHVEVDPVTGVSNLTQDGFADEESSWSDDGTITWVLSKGKMPAIFDSPEAFNILGEARLLIGTAVTGGLVATVDDSPSGFYAFNRLDQCADDKSAFLGVGALPLPLLAFLLGGAALGLRRRA